MRGTWKIESAQDVATLLIEPFETPTEEERVTLIEEGKRLLYLVDDGAEAFEVRLAEKP